MKHKNGLWCEWRDVWCKGNVNMETPPGLHTHKIQIPRERCSRQIDFPLTVPFELLSACFQSTLRQPSFHV